MNTLSSGNSEARNVRILVVDDEEGVRQLVQRWLHDAGYTVHAARDVAEAAQLLDRYGCDLVTCDIAMPGENGAAWMKRLHARHPELPVLMLTACDDVNLAIDALSQGAWGYLLKPLTKDELLIHVTRALERRCLLVEHRVYLETLERTVINQTCELREATEEVIQRLIATSLAHDDETGEHIQRIGVMSGLVTQALGWSSDDVDLIRLAAPMHDIGKVGVPDAILRKPGPLTPAEFEVMKRHTTIGASILSGSRLPMLQMAEQIALSHHEKWDGSGYPHGIRQEQIPLAARVVAVVDVYDALTHDRVYRPRLPEDQALAILRAGLGTHFDPQVVAAFFAVLPSISELPAPESSPAEAEPGGRNSRNSESHKPATLETMARIAGRVAELCGI